VLVGFDAGQAEFDTLLETGGAKTHTLTVNEMPAHTHTQSVNSTATGGLSGYTADTSTNNSVTSGYSTGSTGGGAAHNNLMPYLVVSMWRRTA
jgi:microcystin-dependent protein